MDIILVPGFWLDGDSWAEVTGPLEAAGHCTHALIVDLPTEHWPQLTRPVDLAATIITALQTSQPAGEVAP
ncbi:hypothetical protein GCM10028787_21050 [Brachybacterium horti]